MRQWIVDSIAHVPLVAISGFFIGVGVQSSVRIHLSVILVICVAVVIVMIFTIRYKKPWCLLSVSMLCACLLGVARTELALHAYERSLIFPEGTIVERVATVRDEPDVRDEHTILTLVLDGVGIEPPVHVRVRVPHYPVYAYGDRVTVRGAVERPQSFITDTGRVFNYPGFLMKEGIHYEARYADVRAATGTQGFVITHTLLAVKHAWIKEVSRSIPEPNASLVAGVIVGAKQSLGDMWLGMFRETGIVHIIVLSGYNLSLIALAIMWLTRRFSRGVRLCMGIISICLFVLMTGASATVVRAGGMACMALVAQFLTRQYAITQALITTACVMVLLNPFVLMFDPGFQLSCIATFGLIFISPLFEHFFTHIPKTWGLRTIVSSTCATQCAVLPLLAYQSGQASLVAPLVNVLVLPVIPFLMAIGFMTGVVGLILPFLSAPFAWATHLIAAYVFSVVHLFASIPSASVMLPPVPWFGIVCIYLLMIGTYMYVVRKNKSTVQPDIVDGILVHQQN